jgi:hypothetical protein
VQNQPIFHADSLSIIHDRLRVRHDRITHCAPMGVTSNSTALAARRFARVLIGVIPPGLFGWRHKTLFCCLGSGSDSLSPQ